MLNSEFNSNFNNNVLEKRPKVVVLLSGGLDSATLLKLADSLNYEIYALSFDYEQRHAVELSCARRIIESCANVTVHRIVKLDLPSLAASSLTCRDLKVSKNRENTEEIPNTYVPARNTIFLSIALALAEQIGAYRIFFGANCIDYSNYPDCRPEYIKAFSDMANLAIAATQQGAQRMVVSAPLLYLDKAEIIRLGFGLNLDYSLTSSCYDPNEAGLACGACDSCQIRQKGFVEAGYADPTLYQ
jgi:7-cyano-7-deazaguanine synthase